MSEELLESYQFWGIIGMGVVTFAIRALPFFHVVPKFILKRLEVRQAIFPTMFMTLLVIYCLAPVRMMETREQILLLGGSTIVAALHWYKRNLILSLGVGTAIYLYFMN